MTPNDDKEQKKKKDAALWPWLLLLTVIATLGIGAIYIGVRILIKISVWATS